MIQNVLTYTSKGHKTTRNWIFLTRIRHFWLVPPYFWTDVTPIRNYFCPEITCFCPFFGPRIQYSALWHPIRVDPWPILRVYLLCLCLSFFLLYFCCFAMLCLYILHVPKSSSILWPKWGWMDLRDFCIILVPFFPSKTPSVYGHTCTNVQEMGCQGQKLGPDPLEDWSRDVRSMGTLKGPFGSLFDGTKVQDLVINPEES